MSGPTTPSGRRDVDAYIAAATAAAQPLLRALRAIVISEAPKADERLSYGMPYYEYHGRLIYFAAHKRHIGVYGLAGLGEVTASLQDHFAERGTLRFRFDEPLPIRRTPSDRCLTPGGASTRAAQRGRSAGRHRRTVRVQIQDTGEALGEGTDRPGADVAARPDAGRSRRPRRPRRPL
jgi:uncharacterized protein YdhG (YjbR/CyaY superfamily)